jgi:hypothetical protein
MSSWTADIEWHEDPTARDRINEWTGALEQYAGKIRRDDDTGTLTATVTLEAPSIVEAMPAALRLVEDVTGREPVLRHIAATYARVSLSSP